jgi:hypothetical protein
VTVLWNEGRYDALLAVSYTARQGKTGRTR